MVRGFDCWLHGSPLCVHFHDFVEMNPGSPGLQSAMWVGSCQTANVADGTGESCDFEEFYYFPVGLGFHNLAPCFGE